MDIEFSRSQEQATVKKTCFISVYSRASVARRLKVGILLTSAGEVVSGIVFRLEPLKFKKHVEKPETEKTDQCDEEPGVHKVESSGETGVFSVTE